ncbi:MAG: hypothetical protein IGS03_11660 [Candidatus Sericytochromatia bacterium]|nr:hypothetical protein [Candidatus Sericytochromatia bacterium]
MKNRWMYLLTLPLMLLGLSGLKAQASNLEYWTLEAQLERPARMMVLSQNAPPREGLRFPPGSVYKLFASSPGHMVYEFNQKDQIALFEADLGSGKHQLLLKDRQLHPSAFNDIVPRRNPDGSYFARAIMPMGQALYRVQPGKGARQLPQGGYVFVIWNGQGAESPHYADFITGKKMQLWHQPATGKARQLGSFDTVMELRVVDKGQQVIFFTPGQSRSDCWRLICQPLDGKPAQLVAEIPKPSSHRGLPYLASWPELSWIAYAREITDDAIGLYPVQLMRQQLGRPAQPWFAEDPIVLRDGFSLNGYLTGRLKEAPAGQEPQAGAKWLACWDVRTGQVAASFAFDPDSLPWMMGFCRVRTT